MMMVSGLCGRLQWQWQTTCDARRHFDERSSGVAIETARE